MENSYKFEDNSTKETSIEIPKNQYSPNEDIQDSVKMSLPVNINVASPFLRLVQKWCTWINGIKLIVLKYVISINDDHFHIFQGMGCKTTWRNSSLGDICKHIKFWASAKPSSLEQKIVQKHWTFSVQLRKYIPSHLLKYTMWFHIIRP